MPINKYFIYSNFTTNKFYTVYLFLHTNIIYILDKNIFDELQWIFVEFIIFDELQFNRNSYSFLQSFIWYLKILTLSFTQKARIRTGTQFFFCNDLMC